MPVEYIEKGTFQGGDEDAFSCGFKSWQECIVINSAHFNAMKNALEKFASFEEDPIWSDDRDDAADSMVSIAQNALEGKYE